MSRNPIECTEPYTRKFVPFLIANDWDVGMTIRRNYFRQQADVVMRMALNTSDTVQARLLLMKAYNLLVEAEQAALIRNAPADRGKSSGPQSDQTGP